MVKGAIALSLLVLVLMAALVRETAAEPPTACDNPVWNSTGNYYFQRCKPTTGGAKHPLQECCDMLKEYGFCLCEPIFRSLYKEMADKCKVWQPSCSSTSSP